VAGEGECSRNSAVYILKVLLRISSIDRSLVLGFPYAHTMVVQGRFEQLKAPEAASHHRRRAAVGELHANRKDYAFNSQDWRSV